jgi:hypothetical protein
LGGKSAFLFVKYHKGTDGFIETWMSYPSNSEVEAVTHITMALGELGAALSSNLAP